MRTQTRARAGGPVVAEEVEAWPELPWREWGATADTLHMFTQVLGKLRLALSPPEPHWSHVTLYVTVTGLTTGPMTHDDQVVQATLDLTAHRLRLVDSDGTTVEFPLVDRSVASFYHDTMDALASLGVRVTLNPKPQEVPDPVPFQQDTAHHDYDPTWVRRYHRALLSVQDALCRHRAGYRGIHTTVGLFWGTFDLAYTRYSGRTADPPQGSNMINREAMNAEQVNVGFWPGDAANPTPMLYAYAYPSPPDLERAQVQPADASWNAELGEFVLPYEAVRSARSPRDTVLTFLSSATSVLTTGPGWSERAG
jgi:Family of unknown function (DUF5996)